MTNCPQLSDEQVLVVLRSLRHIWGDALWIDETDFPSDPSESLHDYFERTIAEDSLSLLSLTFALERLSERRVTREQVAMWLNPPEIQSLTDKELAESCYADQVDLNETRGLRGLAEWVWQHCPMLRIEPYRIGSHESLAAGVYVALESVTKQIVPDVRPFGPSSPVLGVIPRKRLETLAAQIECISGLAPDLIWNVLQIPPKKAISIWIAMPIALLLMSVYVVFCINGFSDISAFCLAVGAIVFPFVLIRLFANDGIIGSRYLRQATFGELSRAIARRLTAAETCRSGIA